MADTELALFVRESNWIEGIKRDPTEEEIEAHAQFLARKELTITSFELFVERIQPGATLRKKVGMDVQVGDHVAPVGGPGIERRLQSLIFQANVHGRNVVYMIHRDYEYLHPFTDGNGRSGRAWWLKMMGGPSRVPLGFLHTWYYQSLAR